MRNKRLCSVYKSLREDELYLFVDREEALSRVPEALLKRLGKTRLVTSLVITPERRLARADAASVLAAIEANGFYLQLPPPRDPQLQAMRQKNEKLM